MANLQNQAFSYDGVHWTDISAPFDADYVEFIGSVDFVMRTDKAIAATARTFMAGVEKAIGAAMPFKGFAGSSTVNGKYRFPSGIVSFSVQAVNANDVGTLTCSFMR